MHKTLRGGVKSIFLVGPCIVGGWEAFSGESLKEVLSEKLTEMGLDYNVIDVIIAQYPDSNIRYVLEYDIRKNDIVLFIDDVIDSKEADINLSYIYNNYKGDKWLYSDRPIHTTYTGNILIADEIVKRIVGPVFANSVKENDYVGLHKGEKQLTYEEDIALKQYINGIKKYRGKRDLGIGACVVTCNPFTKGHFHLIDYASRQVNFLYVFVVEEEAVFFPFEDRIEMVRRGLSGLGNVLVCPSGKFIISRSTFKNYFEKEVCRDAMIDASKDTMIFRKYIAPALGISKRFIGEEPQDNITSQYNKLLKKDLNDVMEVIEIPRLEAEGEVISASRVRKYFLKNNWDEIGKLAPQSTKKYLQANKRKIIDLKNRKGLNEIIEFICEHNKVVICGLGEDGRKIVQRLEETLDEKEMQKLEFYDEKSAGEVYRDKIVMDFEQLVNRRRDDYLLITTSKFKKDIFYLLRRRGVDAEHTLVAE